MTDSLTGQLDAALAALHDVEDGLLPHEDAEEIRHARSVVDTVAWRAHQREADTAAMADGGES